ncbi:MAG: hypothetical protein Q9218_005720, partial [Villophora microphyllina]
ATTSFLLNTAGMVDAPDTLILCNKALKEGEQCRGYVQQMVATNHRRCFNFRMILQDQPNVNQELLDIGSTSMRNLFFERTWKRYWDWRDEIIDISRKILEIRGSHYTLWWLLHEMAKTVSGPAIF